MHDNVVNLIKASGEFLTLTVIAGDSTDDQRHHGSTPTEHYFDSLLRCVNYHHIILICLCVLSGNQYTYTYDKSVYSIHTGNVCFFNEKIGRTSLALSMLD